MTRDETLRGARVVLRAPTARDAPALFDAYSDPLVLRYWLSPPHRDLDDTRRLIDADTAASRSGDDRAYVIAVDDGPAVGRLTLELERAHRRATIGFLLARAHWGRGLAGEALSVVLSHAFGPLGLHRVEAYADPQNDASLRCLARAGFRREGVMRERWHVAGQTRDDVVLGLLRHEWPPRGPARERAPVTTSI
jgi:RimJ/RimL family protein N-acetyltransferase